MVNTYIETSDDNSVIGITICEGVVIKDNLIILEDHQDVSGMAYDPITQEFYIVKYDEIGALLLDGNGIAQEDATQQRIKPKQL